MVTDHLDSFVLIALAEEEVFQHELVIGVEGLPGWQESVQVLLGFLLAGGHLANRKATPFSALKHFSDSRPRYHAEVYHAEIPYRLQQEFPRLAVGGEHNLWLSQPLFCALTSRNTPQSASANTKDIVSRASACTILPAEPQTF